LREKGEAAKEEEKRKEREKRIEELTMEFTERGEALRKELVELDAILKGFKSKTSRRRKRS
jgi:hypothetical protein